MITTFHLGDGEELKEEPCNFTLRSIKRLDNAEVSDR